MRKPCVAQGFWLLGGDLLCGLPDVGLADVAAALVGEEPLIFAAARFVARATLDVDDLLGVDGLAVLVAEDLVKVIDMPFAVASARPLENAAVLRDADFRVVSEDAIPGVHSNPLFCFLIQLQQRMPLKRAKSQC